MSPGGSEALVDEAIDRDPHLLPRGCSAFCPAARPLSRQTLAYTAGVIRRHRAQIGSYWRKLPPAQQTLLVLAYLHKGETFAQLVAGFGVGTATAWRYVIETTGLRAAPSPRCSYDHERARRP
jgi:Helix-turn-helix of DDE superfamily endonuclease